MELLSLNPVVQANKKIIVRDKNRCDQWLPKASDWQALFRLLDGEKLRHMDRIEDFSLVV